MKLQGFFHLTAAVFFHLPRLSIGALLNYSSFHRFYLLTMCIIDVVLTICQDTISIIFILPTFQEYFYPLFPNNRDNHLKRLLVPDKK